MVVDFICVEMCCICYVLVWLMSLVDNVVCVLYCDCVGFVWVVINCGLSCYDLC